MTIRLALEEFLTEKKLEGRRPATLTWYRKTVEYLLRDYLDQDLAVLNRALVTKVLHRDVRPSTLALYDRALRGFCNWLFGVGYLQENPFRGRKRPKDEFYLKPVLSLDELKRLYLAAGRDPRFRYRNQAILAVVLSTGLRASELCRLTLQDVLWDEMALRVQGKTGPGVVPLTRDTLKALRLYVERERKANVPWLFVHANKPLTPQSLSRWINRLAKAAGIERPVGMHLLRHTFATHYLRNGGDVFTLQRILRHRSPSMTSRYLHFLTDDLREKLQPLDLVGMVKRR
jgi:integrase/recombinase XerD